MFFASAQALKLHGIGIPIAWNAEAYRCISAHQRQRIDSGSMDVSPEDVERFEG